MNPVTDPQHGLRLTFPAIASNQSPLTVLPQFVDVLGQKINKIGAEMDSYIFDSLIAFAGPAEGS